MIATRLAFIRGVNVGGRGRLPMAELRSRLTELGWANVRTYIQSGNVVYDAPEGAGDSTATLRAEGQAMTAAINDTWGFAPAVIVRTVDDVAATLAGSPYGHADPAQAFLAFFDGDPPALDEFAKYATSGETWQVGDGVAHLHFPEGIGRSRFGAKLTAATKTPTTTRNLRTITKLIALAS